MYLEDLSYKLIGLAMLVQNRYGYGHQEQIYQRALEEVFDKEKIIYRSQPVLRVKSFDTGKSLGLYKPDFVLDEKIVIEIKATSLPVRRFEPLRNGSHLVCGLPDRGEHWIEAEIECFARERVVRT